MNPTPEDRHLPEKRRTRPPASLDLSRLIPECRPLKPPRLGRDFEHQPFFERVVETLTYSARKFEYVVSPEGLLRQWFIFCIRIFIFIAVPSFLFFPLLIYIFTNINTILDSLLLGLIYALGLAIVASLLATLAFSAARIVKSRILQGILAVGILFMLLYLLALVAFRLTFETINATVLRSLERFLPWWPF